jgi:sec-independent protein translocase protein TatA
MPAIVMPGMVEMLIIGGVVVLLFGAKKLPQLGGAIGESIKNFKKGVKDTQKLSEGDEKSDSGTDTKQAE